MVGRRAFYCDCMYLPDTYLDVVAEVIFMCDTGHQIRVLEFFRCQGHPQPLYKGSVKLWITLFPNSLRGSCMFFVMEADSVVDLESEVEEFLLNWSSSTPEDDEVLPEGSGGPVTAPVVDNSLRRGEFAGRATSTPSRVALYDHVGQREVQGVRLRNTGGRYHPYRCGTRPRRRSPVLKPFGGSYMEELKVTWPARYLKLKDSMDHIWKRP